MARHLGIVVPIRQFARTPDKLFGKAFGQRYVLCAYKEGGSEIEVLVITSRESRRWIIPKGWADER